MSLEGHGIFYSHFRTGLHKKAAGKENKKMERKKVIIDCDPGIDDALALMLALSSPELDILGITTVCGNVPPEKGAANALRVLKFMGRLDIPVYTGAEKPLVRKYVSAEDTHGEDGLGESGIPSVEDIKLHTGAVDFITETLGKTDGVSVIAIGPLTNIALALKKSPEAFKHVRKFISMGGCFKSYGNCSPVAEYNYWCDPEAARYVYRNIGQPIHMVGLDVTRKIVLTPNIVEYMRRLDAIIGNFIERITRFYMDFHWKQEKIIGCVINDPLAVAYFLDPEICSGFDAYTDIETEGICAGQSVVDSQNFWHKKPNSHVLTDTDPLAFMTMFISRVFKHEHEEIKRFLCRIMGGISNE